MNISSSDFIRSQKKYYDEREDIIVRQSLNRFVSKRLNVIKKHISNDKLSILEIFRILRTNGTLIFIEPNRFHPLIIAAGLLMPADREVFTFSISNVVKYLKKAGAVDITIQPFNCFTYPTRQFVPDKLRPLFYLLEDMLELPLIAMSRVIIANKR